MNTETSDALRTVNRYFIDLQNRCALTPHEERVWGTVSKAINQPDPEPTYVLFGTDAVNLFENEGMKGFKKEYKKNNEYLSFSVEEISSKATPAEILSLADGWNSYLILSKKEYEKLLKL